MIVLAIGGAVTHLYHSAKQVERDAAACQTARGATECWTQPRPFAVTPTDMAGDGSQLYQIDIATTPSMTFFVNGLTAGDLAPLRGHRTIDVLYRANRPVGFLVGDAVNEFPITPTASSIFLLLGAGFVGFLGAALLVWGLIRSVRGPRYPAYAY